jgi:hypothetical protein
MLTANPENVVHGVSMFCSDPGTATVRTDLPDSRWPITLRLGEVPVFMTRDVAAAIVRQLEVELRADSDPPAD